MQHLEIIFKDQLHPGDVEIITPASADQPGRARLGRARRNGQGRVLSAYGGLIGYVAEGEPLKPYQDTYWLEENETETFPKRTPLIEPIVTTINKVQSN